MSVVTDVRSLSAAQILAIPLDEPERLFLVGDYAIVKGDHRMLAKRWHPDHSSDPEATAVFAHVSALYTIAVDKITHGRWQEPGRLNLTSLTGRVYHIRFQKRHKLPFGEMYVGSTVVTILLDKGLRDLSFSGAATISDLRYADGKMRDEFSRYMPAIKARFETLDHLVVVIEKTKDVLLLRDLLEHLGGKMEPRHVAWVMSALHNLACYFQWAGITHGDLSLDSVFISPEFHSAMPLGGWIFSTKKPNQITALPARTVGLVPSSIISKKAVTPRIDLECIRALGRELLGDKSGANLAPTKDLPKPIVDWLRYSATDDAVAEYRGWKEVLRKCWGPPKFFRLDVTETDIYGEQ